MSYVKEVGKKPVLDSHVTKSGRVRNVDIDTGLADALRSRRGMLRAVAPEFARGENRTASDCAAARIGCRRSAVDAP